MTQIKWDSYIDEIDKNAAVIYPILFKDRLSVILKLPGTNNFRYAAVSESGFEAKFDRKLYQIKSLIANRKRRISSQEKSQFNQLYQWLIKPFETDLETNLEHDMSNIKNLVFVLEGELRHLPMSVLYDSEQERYIVERYAVAVAPGLQLLDPNREQAIPLFHNVLPFNLKLKI